MKTKARPAKVQELRPAAAKVIKQLDKANQRKKKEQRNAGVERVDAFAQLDVDRIARRLLPE